MFNGAEILTKFLFYDVSTEFHPALSIFEKRIFSAHPIGKSWWKWGMNVYVKLTTKYLLVLEMKISRISLKKHNLHLHIGDIYIGVHVKTAGECLGNCRAFIIHTYIYIYISRDASHFLKNIYISQMTSQVRLACH